MPYTRFNLPPIAWRPRIPAFLHRLMTRLGFTHEWFLIPLAAVIGILAGLVAFGFAAMVDFSANVFFKSIARGDFNGGGGLALLAVLPALGGLAVGFVHRYLSKGPPGHGIPEVIEALARQGGRIPGRVGLFKAINSSLTIGSGGSAGMEGPIIQIGSVLGSVVGQFLRVSREHMITLVGCGAAAGLASLFNAPIAAFFFVLEVMLRDFSMRTVMPIVVASIFGTATIQAIHGQNVAIFQVPQALSNYGFTFDELGWYALLGLACGLVGVAYTKGLYATEHFWEHHLHLPIVLKPAAGGLLLGVMGVGFVLWFGQPVATYRPPVFFSNGYPVVEAIFDPSFYAVGNEIPRPTDLVKDLKPAAHPPVSRAGVPATQRLTTPSFSQPHAHNTFPTKTALGLFLLAALVCKLIGTCLTLGSGGSGGVFAPSLFMGAMLGGGFGVLLQGLGFLPYGTPATYALAGMAGVLAGAVHCPLTAFLLVFEITDDYKVILPVMLVAVLATLISQVRLRDSIYTLALRELGIRMGSHSDLTILRRIAVASVPLNEPVIVHPQDPAQRLIDLAVDPAVADYIVCDDSQHYLGMVVGEDVITTLLQREAVPLMIVAELMRTDLPTVSREETLEMALDKFAAHEVASLAVIDQHRQIVGALSRSRLMRFYQEVLEEEA